jgi:hypothetical protein
MIFDYSLAGLVSAGLTETGIGHRLRAADR